ncbi:hypothetical protein B0T09DRAFT_338816 [Sordaria sp. MPI-SDFR-AT-0083]|nr:hypothetical protein B0T09DRAFT_338816 [Sordaria sp. MPI-SDFR-AT-0083]
MWKVHTIGFFLLFLGFQCNSRRLFFNQTTQISRTIFLLIGLTLSHAPVLFSQPTQSYPTKHLPTRSCIPSQIGDFSISHSEESYPLLWRPQTHCLRDALSESSYEVRAVNFSFWRRSMEWMAQTHPCKHAEATRSETA